MTDRISVAAGYDAGGVPRPEWGRRHVNTVLEALPVDPTTVRTVLRGAPIRLPLSHAALVFTNRKGFHTRWRATPLGVFETADAWQDTCAPKRKEGLPGTNDIVLPLFLVDWKNPTHILLLQQFARDWLGGQSTMDILHVHTALIAATQCLLFDAQKYLHDEATHAAYLEAGGLPHEELLVPLWRNLCNGHLVFPEWCRISIQATHDDALTDMMQKLMMHGLTQWLATVRPELFVARPLVQLTRHVWLKIFTTIVKRGMNHGNSNVAENKGILAMMAFVPQLLRVAETSHAPLDPTMGARLGAAFRAEARKLCAIWGEKPSPIKALEDLTKTLSTPITGEQAKAILAFCGTNRKDAGAFPDFEALGILAPRVKAPIESVLHGGPFGASAGSTLKAILEPLPGQPNKAFIRNPQSDQWCGIMALQEGRHTVRADYTGIAKKAAGAVGEWGVGNWRVTYGTKAAGNVMDGTKWGFSHAGVTCNPTLPPKPKPGQAKRWSDPYDPPDIDAPIEITFVRPDYRVVIAGRERLSVKLEPDEYPLFAVKGMHLSWEYAEAIAASASASASAAAGVSECKSSEPDCLVASLTGHIKAIGLGAVVAAALSVQVTEGGTTPLEKELQAALRRIGTEGIAKAISEAQKLI